MVLYKLSVYQSTKQVNMVPYKLSIYPQISFKGVPVNRENLVTHLGIILDSKLNFRKHITEKSLKQTKASVF